MNRDYTDALINEYYSTEKDDLDQVYRELKAKYSKELILYRGWDTAFGNRGGKSNLAFPTDSEKLANNSQAGLFFASEPKYCCDYGDVIKAYIVDKDINLFTYTDAEDFITEYYPELLDYSDTNIVKIIQDDCGDGYYTYNDIVNNYYHGYTGPETLHVAEYLAWLQLKDRYDGVKWTHVVFGNNYAEEYQIGNLNKLKELE